MLMGTLSSDDGKQLQTRCHSRVSPKIIDVAHFEWW